MFKRNSTNSSLNSTLESSTRTSSHISAGIWGTRFYSPRTLRGNYSLTPPAEKPARRTGLKRTIGIGGLFSIGYADVGAGIYLALSLVALHAGYATPIAIGI